jgi:hypothetical protein
MGLTPFIRQVQGMHDDDDKCSDVLTPMLLFKNAVAKSDVQYASPMQLIDYARHYAWMQAVRRASVNALRAVLESIVTVR